MSTHAIQHAHGGRTRELISAPPVIHALWLAGGMLLAFLIPFVLADSIGLNRDLYYAIYGSGMVGYIALWARTTRRPLLNLVTTRWPRTVALGIVAGAILVLMVYRTEDATSRPGGIDFIAALIWRGVVYGAVDGLVLSVFPILAVFAAFAGTRLLRRRRGTVIVGLIALVASLAMTAVYHAGYSDFRGEKMRKPLTGDVIWSAPTLLTLNPIGAPIAHIALHTAAVAHSYDTDTFLPPHEN
jgi:hypothetical protein